MRSTAKHQHAAATRPEADSEEVRGWFAGRLPDEWFAGPPEITLDTEEILVVGRLSADGLPADTPAAKAAALTARAKRFREDTREQRIRIAQEAEHRYGRQISWGAEVGDHRELFTTLALPVMTRLRMAERHALDTLVSGGIARSRSDALAWCVRLVGQHEGEWLQELQDALVKVRQVRAEGPQAD
jgi:hypothetical protein